MDREPAVRGELHDAAHLERARQPAERLGGVGAVVEHADARDLVEGARHAQLLDVADYVLDAVRLGGRAALELLLRVRERVRREVEGDDGGARRREQQLGHLVARARAGDEDAMTLPKR